MKFPWSCECKKCFVTIKQEKYTCSKNVGVFLHRNPQGLARGGRGWRRLWEHHLLCNVQLTLISSGPVTTHPASGCGNGPSTNSAWKQRAIWGHNHFISSTWGLDKSLPLVEMTKGGIEERMGKQPAKSPRALCCQAAASIFSGCPGECGFLSSHQACHPSETNVTPQEGNMLADISLLWTPLHPLSWQVSVSFCISFPSHILYLVPSNL